MPATKKTTARKSVASTAETPSVAKPAPKAKRPGRQKSAEEAVAATEKDQEETVSRRVPKRSRASKPAGDAGVCDGATTEKSVSHEGPPSNNGADESEAVRPSLASATLTISAPLDPAEDASQPTLRHQSSPPASHQAFADLAGLTDPFGGQVFRDSRPPLPASHSLPTETLLPTVPARGAIKKVAQAARADLPVDRESLAQSLTMHVRYTQGKDEVSATLSDYYCATVRTVRDRLFDQWNKTQKGFLHCSPRWVYYLSLEYQPGRALEDALLNLGIHGAMQEALQDAGLDLSVVAQQEPDQALGRSGPGQLSTSLLESSATLGVPVLGYGLRYEYGAFEQQLVDGHQVERADNWLRYGSPWEVMRPETRYLVRFGGHVQLEADGGGRQVYRWREQEQLWAVACDYLVPGYKSGTTGTLRLWTAKATRGFESPCQSASEYIAAVDDKCRKENVTRVLYPQDNNYDASRQRLRQQYFLVSSTLQDIIARHVKSHTSLATLPDHAVVQLNGTATGIAIAELLRLLVDEYGFGWDEAWSITQRTFAFANHTALKDELDTWPVSLFEEQLPRLLQIIYEVNRRFLEEVRSRFPGDEGRVARMSLFVDDYGKRLRMAHLSLVGASVISGVSELHGRILRDSLFRDFAELWPQKFTHVTSGVSVRRWVLKSNPSLGELISSRIGEKWVTEAHQLRRLYPLASDGAFREAFRKVKSNNKERLAKALREVYGIVLDPNSVLDVHAKRIEPHQRQLLCLLHVISLYLSCRATTMDASTPKRTFLFAGKAEPGNAYARDVVELIVAVGRAIERDARARERLAVVFVPNYSVSLAELVIPAADISEQISLSGSEASGTSNMKLALNGALTIGTPDGTNLELAEVVGSKNIFLFGLTASEVQATLRRGNDPHRNYSICSELRAAVDAISRDLFSPDQPGRFAGLVHSLLGEDRFLVLADFVSYRNCHRNVLQRWFDREDWTRRCIMNISNMGRFGSDNVVRNYAREIWKVTV